MIPSVQIGQGFPIYAHNEYPKDEYETFFLREDGRSHYQITNNGVVMIEVFMVHYTFRMFGAEMKLIIGAMFDRGANACLIGRDMSAFRGYNRRASVGGIKGHRINFMQVCDAAGKANSHIGWYILIVLQGLLSQELRTILSVPQIEHYGHLVYNRPLKSGGKQCFVTKEGPIFPFDIDQGLPYLKMYPVTEEDWNKYPHIFITGPGRWDPSIVDCKLFGTT